GILDTQRNKKHMSYAVFDVYRYFLVPELRQVKVQGSKLVLQARYLYPHQNLSVLIDGKRFPHRILTQSPIDRSPDIGDEYQAQDMLLEIDIPASLSSENHRVSVINGGIESQSTLTFSMVANASDNTDSSPPV